jgi:hypothetical protein
MWKDVDQYVKSCLVCQKVNVPPGLKKQGTFSVRKAYRPWEDVQCDTLMGLPTTDRGKDSILTATCMFTRDREFMACRGALPEDYAQFYTNDILCRHGAAVRVATDRGTQFNSEISKSLMEGLASKLKLAPAAHPQFISHDERGHRTLNAMLRKFAMDNPRDWDLYLPMLRFATVTAINSDTRETPFFLNHGRDARLPLSVTLSPYDPLAKPATPSQYANEILTKLQMAFHRVREVDSLKRGSQLANLNKKRREVIFKEGDLVWVRDPTKEKLDSPWTGPFEVRTRVSDQTYEVGSRGDDRIRVLPIERLKAYIPRVYSEEKVAPPIPTVVEPSPEVKKREEVEVPLAPPVAPPTEEVEMPEEEKEWEVEKLVGHKIDKSGFLRFKVRWKGFSAQEDTWELENDLAHAEEILQEYLRKVFPQDPLAHLRLRLLALRRQAFRDKRLAVTPFKMEMEKSIGKISPFLQSVMLRNHLQRRINQVTSRVAAMRFLDELLDNFPREMAVEYDYRKKSRPRRGK